MKNFVLIIIIFQFPLINYIDAQSNLVGDYISVCKENGSLIIKKNKKFKFIKIESGREGYIYYGKWSMADNNLILNYRKYKFFNDVFVLGKIQLLFHKKKDVNKIDSLLIDLPSIKDRLLINEKCYVSKRYYKHYKK